MKCSVLPYCCFWQVISVGVQTRDMLDHSHCGVCLGGCFN